MPLEGGDPPVLGANVARDYDCSLDAVDDPFDEEPDWKRRRGSAQLKSKDGVHACPTHMQAPGQ